ncbi:MAG: glycosyltransferase family 9 protein [Flavobacteriales bacterium]
MGKVLFIQTAFIGDAILATAMLEKWHKSYPEHQISLLVRKGNESLFNNHPFLHELHIWEKNKGKYSSLWKVLKTIRKNKYDLLVNLHRFSSSGFLTVFSGAKETRGFTKNPLSRWFDLRFDHPIGRKGDQQFSHETVRNQQLIAKETGDEAEQPMLYTGPNEKQKVEALIGEPFVTISPSSVWATKAWPSSKWVAVLNQMPQVKVYLLETIVLKTQHLKKHLVYLAHCFDFPLLQVLLRHIY